MFKEISLPPMFAELGFAYPPPFHANLLLGRGEHPVKDGTVSQADMLTTAEVYFKTYC